MQYLMQYPTSPYFGSLRLAIPSSEGRRLNCVTLFLDKNPGDIFLDTSQHNTGPGELIGHNDEIALLEGKYATPWKTLIEKTIEHDLVSPDWRDIFSISYNAHLSDFKLPYNGILPSTGTIEEGVYPEEILDDIKALRAEQAQTLPGDLRQISTLLADVPLTPKQLDIAQGLLNAEPDHPPNPFRRMGPLKPHR